MGSFRRSTEPSVLISHSNPKLSVEKTFDVLVARVRDIEILPIQLEGVCITSVVASSAIKMKSSQEYVSS